MINYNLKRYLITTNNLYNYLIFHPFVKINEPELKNNFMTWNQAIKHYGFTSDRDNLHIAILHHYYGLATQDNTYVFSDEEHYNKITLPLFHKLKMIPEESKPLDEQLNIEILNSLINASGYNRLETSNTFNLTKKVLRDKDEFFNLYPKHKCWEIESSDANLRIKNFH